MTTRVFVSSTYLDLKDHRQAVRSAIMRAGMYPVAMEDFGSRPEEPVTAALEQIETSDIFIGIYARRYGSVPKDGHIGITEREFDYAQKLGIPCYSYLLARDYSWPDEFVDSGDAEKHLTDLIRKVEAATTRSRFTTPESLAAAVAADLARHWSVSRAERLKERRNLSVARCRALWQSAGVPDETASWMADDRMVAVPPAECRASAEKPMVVVVGGQGAGKSLMAERLLQEAIERALNDTAAPVPVIVRALPQITSLEEVVRREALGIGDPAKRGAAIVIDAGEVSSANYYLDLLAAARSLVTAWQSTSVVIFSRPLQVQDKEAVPIPGLSDEQSARLLNVAAGADVFSWIQDTVPRSVRESLDRPLFALLVGAYIRRTGGGRPSSHSVLIAHLAEALLERMGPARELAEAFLRTLAVRSIKRSGEAVPARELNLSRAEVDRLLATGVVSKEGHSIRFTLQVLEDWFAAEAIRRDELVMGQIASTAQMVDRWHYPISVAVSISSSEFVDRVLRRLATGHPGQASDILRDAGEAEPGEAQEARVIGQRMRLAMEAWLEGLGALAARTPWVKDGQILKLGIGHVQRIGNSGWPRGLLTWGWSDASAAEDVFTLPSVIETREVRRLAAITGSEFTADPLWVWRKTLEQIRDWLRERLVKRPHRLLLDLPIPRAEHDWQYARTLAHWTEAPIPLPTLRTALHAKSSTYESDIEREARTRLEAEVESLLANRLDVLSPPWPLADVPHETWTWLRFSDEQTVQRTRAVFEGALVTYGLAVERMFPKFAERLHLAGNLPARVEARLLMPSRRTPAEFPGIRVKLYPLAVSERTTFNVRIATADESFEWLSASEFRTASDELRALRSLDVPWLFPVIFDSVLDIYSDRPVTELTARWLESDLRACDWLP